MGTGVWQGVWRLADPKITLTSVASMYLGAAMATTHGPLHWGWLAVTALGLFAFEAAKNATGDIVDYDSGTDLAVAPADRTPFSGGKRVLVDELLTRRQTWAVAAAFGAIGALAGLAIVVFREPQVLWLGAVGVILGWSYHGWPARLAYRGLGELDVTLCYGPLIAAGTCLVQTHRWSWEVVWLSLPLGLLIGAFLWVNEFPDYAADKAAGKRNLVVRLGRPAASRALAVILLAALAIVLALPPAGLPVAAWAGLLAAPPAAYAAWRVWRSPENFYITAPAQPAMLIAFLLYSAGAGTGILLG